MSRGRSPVGRLLALAGLLLALALAFGWLPRAIVSAQLALDAAALERQQQRHGTPFAWDFGDAAAAPPWVARGSSGIAAATPLEGGTRFASDGRAIDLSIDLGGRRLPWSRLAIAEVEASAPTSLSLRLLGDEEGASTFATRLDAVLAPGQERVVAGLVAPRDGAGTWSTRLRLRAESSTDGTGITLRRLRLLPAGGPCGEGDSPPCPLDRAELRGATPESLLAMRDHMLEERPLAVASPVRVDQAMLALMRSAGAGALGWLPAAAAAAGLLLATLARVRPTGRRLAMADAARGLALFGALSLLVLSLPFDARAAFVLVACVGVAAWAPGRRPGPGRAGPGPVVAAALAGLVLLGAIAAAGLALGQDPALRWPGAWEAARYLAWSLLQLLLLKRLMLELALRAAPSPLPAVLLTGLLFALLHLPNLGLMLLTAVAGTLWAALSLRGASLPALALAHATLGLCALVLVPPAWLRSAEVGARFTGVLP